MASSKRCHWGEMKEDDVTNHLPLNGIKIFRGTFLTYVTVAQGKGKWNLYGTVLPEIWIESSFESANDAQGFGIVFNSNLDMKWDFHDRLPLTKNIKILTDFLRRYIETCKEQRVIRTVCFNLIRKKIWNVVECYVFSKGYIGYTRVNLRTFEILEIL